MKGDSEGKGDDEGKGDGEGGWSREGDGNEKGDGEKKGLPGPLSPFVGGPGPSSLSLHRVCVLVVLSLGHVTSSSLHVAWSCCCSESVSCCHWAMLPARHRCVSGHVIIVACPRWRCCAVLVTLLCGVIVPA